jgi:hypothetical protein
MKSEPPEPRLVRVDAIRRMVDEGTYDVPAEAVAAAILRHHQRSARRGSVGERPVTADPPETDDYN